MHIYLYTCIYYVYCTFPYIFYIESTYTDSFLSDACAAQSVQDGSLELRVGHTCHSSYLIFANHTILDYNTLLKLHNIHEGEN